MSCSAQHVLVLRVPDRALGADPPAQAVLEATCQNRPNTALAVAGANCRRYDPASIGWRFVMAKNMLGEGGDNKGWGWVTMLGDIECWFGRGPSGHLLGPFPNKNACAEGIEADEKRIATHSNPDREKDLAMTARREADFSSEDDWPVWVLEAKNTASFYIITGPGGLEPEAFLDARDAANAAIDKKRDHSVKGG